MRAHAIIALFLAASLGFLFACMVSRQAYAAPINAMGFQSQPSPDSPSLAGSIRGNDPPAMKHAASITTTLYYTVNLPLVSKPDPTAQFIGYWTNQDAATPGIPRVEISSTTGTLLVHMWGACTPTLCDWGETSTGIADADDGVLSLVWTFSFAVETQKLSALPDGRLQLVGHTHFTDNSGRQDQDYIEYFVRASADPDTPTGFSHQSTYTGNCANRPYGSACVTFSDAFRWLVYDNIGGWTTSGYWQGKEIQVASGLLGDYYHILLTDYVKYVAH